jgi:hypothetical protein
MLIEEVLNGSCARSTAANVEYWRIVPSRDVISLKTTKIHATLLKASSEFLLIVDQLWAFLKAAAGKQNFSIYIQISSSFLTYISVSYCTAFKHH